MKDNNSIKQTTEISVLVPVYNVQEFLPQCLDSLLNQLGSGRIEIILVDDGSTDNSSKICDEYSRTHPDLIKVIHKTNGGLASARQAGLDIAKGKYIAICDSDDWIEPNAYQKLLNSAISNDADVVISDYNCVYDNGNTTTIRMNMENCNNNKDFLKKICSTNKYNSLWNKLIKRSIFIDNNLKWIEGINLGEDALMTSRIFSIPNLKVKYLPEPLYNYRRRIGEDTYTNNLTKDKWEQLRYVYELRKQIIPGNLLIDSACDVIFAGLRCSDITNHQISQFARNNIKYFQLLSIKPKRIIALSCRVLGINLTKFVVQKLYRFVYK